MELVVGTIVNILMLSSVYILVALGFAFLFSMLRILNLAHGAIYMIGGYIGLVFITNFGLNPWIAVVLSAAIVGAFGIFLERFCFRPFVGDFNRIVMIGVVVIITLETTVNIIAGTQTLGLPPFLAGSTSFLGTDISNQRLIIFAISAVLLAATLWFAYRTRLGLQMLAISQNIQGAALQGINVHRISSLASFIGCALAAVAGCFMGSFLYLTPFMGDYILVKVLILVMIAGVGSINGIIIAGFILGALDAVLPILTSGATSDAIVISVIVVILLLKPQGFFGLEA
jgi:branched-chain amino acid transport system permease protein